MLPRFTSVNDLTTRVMVVSRVFVQSEQESYLSLQERADILHVFDRRKCHDWNVRPFCLLWDGKQFHKSLAGRSMRSLFHPRNGRKFRESLADRSLRPLSHLRHERKFRDSPDYRNKRPPFHLRNGRKIRFSLAGRTFVSTSLASLAEVSLVSEHSVHASTLWHS